MPENIINLDAHRNKDQEPSNPAELLERMSMIEDMIEQLNDLGVTTREELVELLDTLEASAPETLD